MLENIKLSFEEVSGDATTTTTITINKKVSTLDEALDAIRNHYSGSSKPAKPAEASTPLPPQPPAPETPAGGVGRQGITDKVDKALGVIRNQYSEPSEPTKSAKAPAPPTPPTGGSPTPPPPPPAPPTGGPTPPPAPPAGVSAGGIDRQGLIDKINEKFETDPKYKDFMQIINVMKQATAPNEKTAINDFTDEEVQKLADLVL